MVAKRGLLERPTPRMYRFLSHKSRTTGQVTSPRRASDDVNAKSPPETFTVVKEVNKFRFHQDGKRKLLPRKRIGMRNRDTGPRPCDSRPSTRTAGVPLPVPVPSYRYRNVKRHTDTKSTRPVHGSRERSPRQVVGPVSDVSLQLFRRSSRESAVRIRRTARNVS